MKDVFHVKGVDTFMGYAGWVGTQGEISDDRKRKESQIVKVLYALGAVLYCKVNRLGNYRLRLTFVKTSCPQRLAVSPWIGTKCFS